MTIIPTSVPGEITPALADSTPLKPARITSIDAVRGFIMLTMIYVNDLAGAPESANVPNWMKHASDALNDMRRAGIKPLPESSWMTFVDLVFPGFLFIVGMSIPFALGRRLKEPLGWLKALPHIFVRSASLLLLGILMASGSPTASKMPWSHFAAPATASATTTAATSAPMSAHAPETWYGSLAGSWWVVFWYTAAFLAFCQIVPFWVKKDDLGAQRLWKWITIGLRIVGLALLAWLIIIYERDGMNRKTHVATVSHIITFNPFYFQHRNAEILGLIAWAYLAAALLFVVFRTRRLALAVATACMFGFWICDRSGAAHDFKLAGFLAPLGESISYWVTWFDHNVVGISECLGSLAAISVAGVILATVLITPETATIRKRVNFTLLFIAATAFAALVFYKPWGIWKNSATPSWCLWACSITASVWLLFYLIGDVLKMTWLTKPFAIAGQNVLLAYLLSEGLESFLRVLHLGDWYDQLGSPTLAAAISRSLGLGIVLLAITALLNWLGFRLKL
jgi:heparan-alpha-glucosaminide N-acetyltransferase